MLDTTLASSFDPGSVRKGGFWGANWLFLMPSLDLGRVLCIGPPTTTALATLSRHADDVLVACGDCKQAREVRDLSRNLGLTNIHPFLLDSVDTEAVLPLSTCDTDLIVMGRFGLQLVDQNSALAAELKSYLKPGGSIYVDYVGRVDGLLKSMKVFGAPDVYWFTPLFGETRSAVPLLNQKVIRYFLAQELIDASVTKRWLAPATRMLKTYRALGRPTRERHIEAGQAASVLLAHAPGPARLTHKPARALALNTAFAVKQAVDRAERFLSDKGWISTRYGAVLGQEANGGAVQPPEYLCALARREGVEIEGLGWGLSAPTEYPARKIVFFLFEAEQASPRYIIRLVRDPAYNARLENENRALTLLREARAVGPETIPDVAFFGYSRGLAIIGQKAIQGMPLRRLIRRGDDWSHARSVIEWLTGLGAATASFAQTPAPEAAYILDGLLRRFAQIYRVEPAYRDFLVRQIDTIARSSAAFPLVFQHGDCHTGNILITPAGRAAFVDWERAEPAGIPLWDLLYFLRNYSSER
ncbi:MAG TPA: aminoglycoside phosphotransferase family protein, partial [Blastocatellia bacterium]|nr:aminoglycoside phosphotransferase family protein [Blastocatellia bacterium]